MSAPVPIDPASVVAAILGTVVGPVLAQLIGFYAVVILAACAGAGWALSRREPDARMGAMTFFILLVVTTTLVTAGITMAVDQHLKVGPQWLAVPVALLVAGIGPDWPAVIRWVIGLVKGRIEALVARAGESKGGGS